jgi:hypothetical protein
VKDEFLQKLQPLRDAASGISSASPVNKVVRGSVW